MSAAAYPVRSVLDMARIPEAAWPKLIAELPHLLAAMRTIVLAYDAARDAGHDIPEDAYTGLLASAVWIDDDARSVTLNVKARDEAGGLHPVGTLKYSMGDEPHDGAPDSRA